MDRLVLFVIAVAIASASAARQKEKDWIWLGIRLITHQCHYWTDSSIMLQEIGRNRDCGQKGTGIMKGFGWFCVILGCASFLGAAINGNSVFGPAFWLAWASISYIGQKIEKKNKNITEYLAILAICRIFAANI